MQYKPPLDLESNDLLHVPTALPKGEILPKPSSSRMGGPKSGIERFVFLKIILMSTN